MTKPEAAQKHFRSSGFCRGYRNYRSQTSGKAAIRIAGGLLILIALMAVWWVTAYTFVSLLKAFIMVCF